MIDIDIRDRTEQRKFGLVLAAAFCILAGIRWAHEWWRSGETPSAPWVVLGIAAFFFVFGLAYPRGLLPIFWFWIRLAIVLNWLVTHIVLTFAFYVLLTPIAIWIRLFKDDPLKRKWLADAASYWEEPEKQPDDIARYFKQY